MRVSNESPGWWTRVRLRLFLLAAGVVIRTLTIATQPRIRPVHR
jgi:hypothetical protein